MNNKMLNDFNTKKVPLMYLCLCRRLDDPKKATVNVNIVLHTYNK